MGLQDVRVLRPRPGAYQWSQIVGRVDTYELLAPGGTVVGTWWPEPHVDMPSGFYSHLTELAWHLNDDAGLPLCRRCGVDSAVRERDLCPACVAENRQ